MRLARIVLALSALPFAGIGVAFLVQPKAMALLVGVEVTDATADADVRAVYGGLQLGCALLLAGAATRPAWVHPGLVAQIVLYGGLAAARFVSYAVVGLPSALGLALHLGEIVGWICGVAAWQAVRRRPLGP